MAEDHEVLRETWEGKIAVCFVLAAEEVSTVEQPEPIYMMVSRQTYFPLVTDRVLRIFTKHVDPDLKSSQSWLEDKNLPLKWHYPVGVLFDLLGAKDRLPWTITVHFQNFPEGDLLECLSKDAVEAHFISSVKEADSLKHRSQIMNAMQRKDHKQLWSALVNDKFDQFWQVNRKLMENSGDNPLKYIPFRIYTAQGNGFIQRLFRPLSDDSERTEHLLGDLLRDALPSIFSKEDGASLAYQVVIQGIEPAFDSPVMWLSLHLSHPDNFLHICIIPSS